MFSALLETDSIYLREVTLADVNESYRAWMNDPVINQYLETRFVPQSLENIRAFVASKDGNSSEPFFAICSKDSDKHIGNIKLGPINWHHRRADISLLVGDKDYWGKGIATQAIALVTRFAFDQLNLNKLQAGAYAPNLGSINAFKKNRFFQEGYIEEFCTVNNSPVDMVLLGLTRTQFYADKNE